MKLKKPLILASQSPRRKQIMMEAGFDFSVKTMETREAFPSEMDPVQVAPYLAHQKARPFLDKYPESLILTADTVVICQEQILNKPDNLEMAFEMLNRLSGQEHQVITGVALLEQGNITTFKDTTTVVFRKLLPQEISFYVQTYLPLDKAGAYGIQEWIGMIGIEQIRGSFYNVMGLPIHKIYQELKPYILY
ncbi:MAG: Maf family nucleotide pyrophosphatase [Candidatus Cyclobacteriaceae bacterium M3_2C_046]